METIENDAILVEEQKENCIIFRITGRLDVISSSLTEKKVFEAINNGHTNLLLDLSKVTYLSSAGMRMLLSTTKKIRTTSGKIAVCGTKPNVMDVLKMSGFDHILDLFKTEELALRNF